jgi:hypothetical protein
LITASRWSAALLALLAVAPAARAQDRSGWSVLGGEAGFIAGAAGGAALLYALGAFDEPAPRPPGPLQGESSAMLRSLGLAAAIALPVAAGATFGALGTGALADRRGWSGAAGWGATGAIIGAVAGGSAGGAFAAAGDTSKAISLLSAGAGALAGGTAGYFAFHSLSANNGSATWENIGAWTGLGIFSIAFSIKSGDEAKAQPPLLAAAGAGVLLAPVLGAAIAHWIAAPSRPAAPMSAMASVPTSALLFNLTLPL